MASAPVRMYNCTRGGKFTQADWQEQPKAILLRGVYQRIPLVLMLELEAGSWGMLCSNFAVTLP